MLIGKRLSGRYKILKVIGGGGMANVYLARDMILDRDVAIKVLRFDFANDDEFIKRFRREAQSATSLAHPNVVSIYDVGEEDGIYYIVMEYVEGRTLKQYIQQFAPVHPREALNIMIQVVAAIDHAHENQIVHRDIKPHNILIDPHGNAKVTDFGIAIALSATTITQTNSVMGTVHYLSPEQARGGLANKKSDIYSLGIVMFELLTGRLPFDGESAISIALKHLQSDTPSPKRWNPDISQSVENIILKATAKDSFHRYNSATEMEEDIRTAFDVKRLNEPKFAIPEDDEATKAIPIITNEDINSRPVGDTLVRSTSKTKNGHQESVIPTDEEHKKKLKKKKKNKFAIFIITTFILLIVAGVAAFFIVPPLLLPSDIEIPEVAGETYEDAEEILIENGFLIGEKNEIASEEVEEGNVVRTDPKAGSMAKEGSRIDIFESIGKEKVELDDYVGKDIDRVRQLLERDGFTQIDVETEFHDIEPAGTILRQDPEVGEEVVPSEDHIEFLVSAGPKLMIIEDLKGKTEADVLSYVKENGFTLTEDETYSNDVPSGQVISTTPNAGAEVVPKETTLEVIYSLGPEPAQNKTVSKEIEIPYDPEEEGQEQLVTIQVADFERTFSDPYASFAIKEATSRTIEFIIEPEKEAYYQIIIDNRVVKSEKILYPE